MKRVINTVMIVLMILSVVGVTAQQGNRGRNYNQNTRQENRDQGYAHRAERMAVILDLNDKQKEQVAELYKELTEERIALNQSKRDNRGKPTQEQIEAWRSQSDKFRENMSKGMKKILSKSQFDKWEKLYDDGYDAEQQQDVYYKKGKRGRAVSMRRGHFSANHQCYCGLDHGTSYQAPTKGKTTE